MFDPVLILTTLALAATLFGCGESSSSSSPPPQPGIYHLDGVPWSVTNVRIDPRGTFRWGGGACDVYVAGDGGQWHAVGDRLVLTPIGDNTVFEWTVPLNESATILDEDQFQSLEAVGGLRKGELIISGLGTRWGEHSATWTKGGVCLTGCDQTAPCDDPDVGVCPGNDPPAYCHPDG